MIGIKRKEDKKNQDVEMRETGGREEEREVKMIKMCYAFVPVPHGIIFIIYHKHIIITTNKQKAPQEKQSMRLKWPENKVALCLRCCGSARGHSGPHSTYLGKSVVIHF